MYCTNRQVVVVVIIIIIIIMYSRDTGCEYESISAIVFVAFLYFAPVIYCQVKQILYRPRGFQEFEAPRFVEFGT